jgi:hypothetical protein
MQAGESKYNDDRLHGLLHACDEQRHAAQHYYLLLYMYDVDKQATYGLTVHDQHDV